MSKWPVQVQQGTRCIVSGTPGIGKTTFLYYLTWKFLRRELRMEGGQLYQNLVLGDANKLLLINAEGRYSEHAVGEVSGRILPFSLGLFDITSGGAVSGVPVNTQSAHVHLRVHHLIVAATPGFRQRDLSEFVKGGNVVESEENGSGVTCVPRLCLCTKDDFEKKLKVFIHALMGQNLSGKDVDNKNAHTMLVIRHSPILDEENEQTFARFVVEAEEGRNIGFVSEGVQQRVFSEMLSLEQSAV
eukprot:5953988-Amphidinium_carterae.2